MIESKEKTLIPEITKDFLMLHAAIGSLLPKDGESARFFYQAQRFKGGIIILIYYLIPIQEHQKN